MIFILLIIFQIKHFICDYPLQGRYMLGKFREYPKYIIPLLAHVSVHGLFTGLIAVALCYHGGLAIGTAALCVGIDMGLHFCMDRIKASPALLGRYKPMSSEQMKEILTYVSKNIPLGPMLEKRVRDNTLFWWSLGIDQGVHHLSHYLIIAIMVGAI